MTLVKDMIAQAQDLGLQAESTLGGATVFEGPRHHSFYLSKHSKGRGGYQHYTVYLPGVRYRFRALRGNLGLRLAGVHPFIVRGNNRQLFNEHVLTNGTCYAFYHRFPEHDLPTLINEYWHSGFNRNAGIPRNGFFAHLVSEHGGMHEACEAWEQLSPGKVIELLNEHGR